MKSIFFHLNIYCQSIKEAFEFEQKECLSHTALNRMYHEKRDRRLGQQEPDQSRSMISTVGIFVGMFAEDAWSPSFEYSIWLIFIVKLYTNFLPHIQSTDPEFSSLTANVVGLQLGPPFLLLRLQYLAIPEL
jgi:hypothetical protein